MNILANAYEKRSKKFVLRDSVAREHRRFVLVERGDKHVWIPFGVRHVYHPLPERSTARITFEALAT